MQLKPIVGVCTVVTVLSTNAFAQNQVSQVRQVPQTRARDSAAADTVWYLTLSQTFGKAVYSKCDLSASGPGKGYLTLRCARNSRPPADDLVVDRTLSAKEAETLAPLVERSNLFDGGHVGLPAGGEGPDELLEVVRYSPPAKVALVTLGNPTFQGGARRQLLQQLIVWRSELLKTAERRATQRQYALGQVTSRIRSSRGGIGRYITLVRLGDASHSVSSNHDSHIHWPGA